MRFYGRETELSVLERAREHSKTESQFTVVMGRRRIGKTKLILESLRDTKYVYLFISRLSEPVLCSRMQTTLEGAGIEINGTIGTVGGILKAAMLASRNEPLTLVFDEFQDLSYAGEGIFSDIQEVWDIYRDSSHLNLIVSGSSYSLMENLFEDSKAPLFSRPTYRIYLRPFTVSQMKQIMGDYHPGYSNEDLLMLYALTGGIPFYVSLLIDVSPGEMLRTALSEGSVFLSDGRTTLVSEFGKDYNTYFSILQTISEGHCKRNEIDSIVGTDTGAYLERLRSVYGFIRAVKPILSDKGARNVRWEVDDMYLRFYFRFLQPNADLIESGRFDLLYDTVRASIENYEGRVLEDYFRKRISEEDRYTSIGRWWTRDGRSEIDIVLIDASAKKVEFVEVKRDSSRYRVGDLVAKSAAVLVSLPNYVPVYRCLSMDDM